jgi:hypothetical protein
VRFAAGDAPVAAKLRAVNASVALKMSLYVVRGDDYERDGQQHRCLTYETKRDLPGRTEANHGKLGLG